MAGRITGHKFDAGFKNWLHLRHLLGRMGNISHKRKSGDQVQKRFGSSIAE